MVVFIKLLDKMHTRDIMYNVMLNTDSFNIKNLASTNKEAKLIYNDKHFWKELFEYRDIPILNLSRSFRSDPRGSSFEEMERYEKTYHIAKNILALVNNKYGIGMTFDNKKIIEYLPENMIKL